MPSHIILLGVAAGFFHLVNSTDNALLDNRGMTYMLAYCVIGIYVSAWLFMRFAVVYWLSVEEETMKTLAVVAGLALGLVFGWVAVGKFVGYRK